MWTQFWDMHSGGGQKLDWSNIYIEAPQDEAEIIFQNAFGRNPHRVTCTCCGEDYSLSESESLAQATGYHRNCRNLETPRQIELSEYCKRADVKVIPASEIRPEWRNWGLHREGYIWEE